MIMDGYLMRKLMEEKGYSADEMMDKFRDFMRHESSMSSSRTKRYHDDDFDFGRFRREGYDMESKFRRMMESMSESEKREMWESMRDFHESGRGRHFSPAYARQEVSDMHHTEGGNKHKGEKYPIERAEEVFKRYKSLLPEDTTVADVYVAINNHYHKYAQLFKAWFGDNIDTKIFEAAIVFWFKDDEFPENEKLWKFFQMK